MALVHLQRGRSVKQAMSMGNGNPLLAQAASRLRPPIFSHPVWVRFGKMEGPATRKLVDELLYAAGRLQDDDPSSACQILLISAVYQNYAGRRDDALRTTQQALALAERNSLAREMIWATWGACAVCFQAANYEQAARYLEYLQTGLSEQSEWMLADFVEVIKQALLCPGSANADRRSGWSWDQSSGDLLSLTFERLRHWGFSAQGPASSFEPDAGRSISQALLQEGSTHPPCPGQHRRGTWDSLVRAIKGELSLQWVERQHPRAGQGFSVWHSIFGSIRSDRSGRIHEPQTREHVPQPTNMSESLSGIERLPANLSSHASEPESTSDRASGHAAAITTVVVQMLGPFSLTIQNSPLKLPSSRGLSLLKYLLLHHNQDIPREILMDMFWRDADPEAARNNLNVALHSLRQALRSVTDVPVIRFEDGAHGLATDLEIWLDVDEFEHYIKDGQRLEARDELKAAVIEYELAVDLYRGDFLADSPYEGWTALERERLQFAYVGTLERLIRIYFSQERYAACVTLCQLLLSRDPCREDVHCRLMQCYSRLGQSPLALRQYQICVEALRVELEAKPAPETTRLYNRIRRHERA